VALKTEQANIYSDCF